MRSCCSALFQANGWHSARKHTSDIHSINVPFIRYLHSYNFTCLRTSEVKPQGAPQPFGTRRLCRTHLSALSDQTMSRDVCAKLTVHLPTSVHSTALTSVSDIRLACRATQLLNGGTSLRHAQGVVTVIVAAPESVAKIVLRGLISMLAVNFSSQVAPCLWTTSFVSFHSRSNQAHQGCRKRTHTIVK